MTDQPNPSGIAGPVVRRRAIRVRFLNGSAHDVFIDELPALVRHPLVMIYIAATIAISLTVSVLLAKPDTTSHALLFPIFGFGTACGAVAFIALTGITARLRRKTDPVRLFLPIPFACCIALEQVVIFGLWDMLLGMPAISPAVTLMTIVIVYMLDEVLLFALLIPNASRILDEARNRDVLPLRPTRGPALAAEGPAQLVTGSTRLALASVQQMRAQGNYVEIWTDTGPVQVPGPFSTLLSQFPDTLGCLVHRSEWVATRAVVSARRDGRATVLALVNGNVVRVASSRAEAVRDWLAQFETGSSRRRSSSSGGGDTKRQSRPADDTTTSAIGASAPSAPSAFVKPAKS